MFVEAACFPICRCTLLLLSSGLGNSPPGLTSSDMMDGRASTMDQKVGQTSSVGSFCGAKIQTLTVNHSRALFYHLTPLSFSISPVSATIETTGEDEFDQVRKDRTVGEPGAGRTRGRDQGGRGRGRGLSGGGVSASFSHRALPPWLRLSCLCPRPPLLIKLLFCQHGGAHSDSRGFVRVMLWGMRQKGAAGQSL